MKKLAMTGLALCVVLAAGIAAARHGGWGGCFGGAGCYPASDMTAEQKAALGTFNEETYALRKEAVDKRYELEKELLKQTPDAAKVKQLESELDAIRAKVLKLRETYGLSRTNCGKQPAGKGESPCGGAPCSPCGGPCGQNTK